MAGGAEGVNLLLLPQVVEVVQWQLINGNSGVNQTGDLAVAGGVSDRWFLIVSTGAFGTSPRWCAGAGATALTKNRSIWR
jgi:hypothetical protein